MAQRLEPPPVPPVGKFTDQEMGLYVLTLWRWLERHYQKTGGAEPVLPASLGGTGTSSLAQTVAAQQAATTNPSATALTQSKTSITLTRPATAAAGDFADTVITWAAAFADATYSVTLSEVRLSVVLGTIDVVAQTANNITVRLTNDGLTVDGETAPAAAIYRVDVTGVHA
jgi:hypothetical protein